MDNEHLNKYFSTEMEGHEQLEAYAEIRAEVRHLAESLNRLVPESQSKADILGRLFRIGVDAELAVRMDGVSRMVPMIVTTTQCS